MNYYFYKATIEPKDGCAYYDHSNGVAGYHYPQSGKRFITYGTLEDIDRFLNERQARTAERRYR